MDRCFGYDSDINTASPIFNSLLLSFLFTLLLCTGVNHLQGLQYDALTHPEARNVHVCLSSPADVDDINQPPIFLPYGFTCILGQILILSSCIHSPYTVCYIRSPRFPTTPECDLSHHHHHNHNPTTTRSHERMNSPHTPYNLPLPSPLSNPLSHWWLVNPGRTWSWMHHIHIPPVWNLQKQVGSPSFRHPSRSLRGQ